tara:strand:- start:90 stop:320 length:231 start_codon:yes stop_codon:yes gene_type:complete
MKWKYYKTISPSLAKKRIAKLVERSRETWNNYQKADKRGSISASEYWRNEWKICSLALLAMGISEDDYTNSENGEK